MTRTASQSGVTLIEVLVALLLMAFGLIGIAALQTSAISSNQVSSQYTQAALLTQNMVERMRANRDAVVAGSYLMAAGTVGNPAANCATTSCTSAQQAQWDLASWYASAAASISLANVPAGPSANLPGVMVSIACAATCTEDSVRMVTLYWDADRTGATGTGCDSSLRTDLRCFRLPYLP